MITILRVVLLLSAFFALASCAEIPVIEARDEIKQLAIEEAQLEIHDPQAVMPDWYRGALWPTFTVTTEYTGKWPFSQKKYQKPIPHIDITAFWAAAAFFILIPVAILHLTEVKDGDWVELYFVYVMNAAILCGVAKIFVHYYFGPDHYIPWHFALLLGFAAQWLLTFLTLVLLVLRVVVLGMYRSASRKHVELREPLRPEPTTLSRLAVRFLFFLRLVSSSALVVFLFIVFIDKYPH